MSLSSTKLRLSYSLQCTAPDSAARAGLLKTRRGEVETPIFMPVGTQATVRGMDTQSLIALGPRIILANTYHLLLRPGPKVFQQFGGIHDFMKWPNLVLTDSGGFQIFSLPNSRKMSEEGASFKSYVNGEIVQLSPETSIEMQSAINSDIMMVLDECVPATSTYEESQRAMNLTHRWAKRSFVARGDSDQALFGIVQGACHESLRRESTDFLQEINFDGYAIGGLAVGETKAEREHFTELSAKLLPEQKPRYLMGVGTPLDLLEAVHRGVDMFDCILPSSLAQQGTALSNLGWTRLRRSVYRYDKNPISEICSCSTCATYSRAYLHHLIRANEGLGWRLIAQHNFHFYCELMKKFRSDIFAGTFFSKYKERQESLGLVDIDYPAVAETKREKFQANENLGDYQVVIRSDGPLRYGVIKQKSSGEIMHPLSFPDQEAKDLYVKQSKIEDLLSVDGSDDFIIWDVGLGAGHNAMAVVNLVENMMKEDRLRRSIKLLSFENDLNSFELGMRNKNYFHHLRHRAPEILKRNSQYLSECERLDWQLIKGNFLENLSKFEAANVIMYDPFSSKTNAELWQLKAFSDIAQTMTKKPAVLVTYSSSTIVRASLLASGFHVFAASGSGSRKEATLALLPGEGRHPVQDQSILLDQRWLERWKRSSAKSPEQMHDAERFLFEKKVLEHPQFQIP